MQKKLLILFVTALLLRLWFVSDHNIIFWYDQARDAVEARQLWSGQLKLMGPVASVTDSTFYHGVLYYYLIAPFYGIMRDPEWSSYFFGFLGALSIPLYYWLGFSIIKKKSAGFALATLFTFSSHSVITTTLLANPTIAIIVFPVYFLSIWKIFFERTQSKKWWLILGLSYGICVQAALWLAPLIIIPIISALLLYFQSRKKYFKLLKGSRISIAIIATSLMVSTIIISQFKLIQTGVLTLERFEKAYYYEKGASLTIVIEYFRNYGNQIIDTYFPSNAFIALLIFGICITRLSRIEANKRKFYLILLSAPIMIGSVFPRVNYHFFYMTSIPLYLLVVEYLINLTKPFKYFTVIILSIFIVCNLLNLRYLRLKHFSLYDQWGTTLKDSLALIDHTYAVAELDQFSIDSYTESYPYNAVWSYLYSWYGQNKYGYIPTISGISQTSMNHGGLLPESNSSSDQKKHFAIVQPNVLLPAEHLNAFLHSQENGSGITPTKKVFGTLKLYEYP